jgi:bifunctional UDP-N-acetylglucosamine pyrophosphorylase / glucosamine-1-phosphate N-acetyltransferase
MSLATVILAAGKGKRMKSDLPKVLHPLLGRPMIHYVIETARAIGSTKIILVVGHKKELVMDATRDEKVDYAVQEQQLGTGHAVLQARPFLQNDDSDILVLSGDVPLLTPATLNQLIKIQQKEHPQASLLTAEMEDPTGYGRIVRNKDGYVSQIVEHKDASAEILKIREINVGIYIFRNRPLFDTLPGLSNNNSQGEYYLPDVVKIYVDRGEKVAAILTAHAEETHGINDIDQLKHAEKILMSRK